jgi:hypothetical protein
VAQHISNLSGRWLGRYEYIVGAEPVPFEAELVDELGAIYGQISEPNTFRRDISGDLRAVFDGDVNGAAVSFVKRYLGFSHDDDPMYSGVVNAAMTRIEGRWSFPTQPWWSGRFVMMRKPVATASWAQHVEVDRELEFTEPR